jgi:tetratricopeptide (TPR) repeat protein
VLSSALRSRMIFAPEQAAESMAEMESASTRALELAPSWSAAHLDQTWRQALRRDWLAVERSLNNACKLGSPLTSDLETSLGEFHSMVNDSRTAIEHYRTAAALDPLSLLRCCLLQKELIVAGRYDEAEVEYRRGFDLAGDREIAEHLVLHMLWARGEPFREQFRRYLDLAQSRPAPVLDDLYPVCEDPPRALEKLRAAAAAPESQTPPQQVVLAWWLAAYGDVEAAFAAIWHSYVDLNFTLVDWLWFPVFAQTREHARFPELLERVRLVAYWRAKNH